MVSIAQWRDKRPVMNRGKDHDEDVVKNTEGVA
jgi:hypothetical protein